MGSATARIVPITRLDEAWRQPRLRSLDEYYGCGVIIELGDGGRDLASEFPQYGESQADAQRRSRRVGNRVEPGNAVQMDGELSAIAELE